MSPLIQCMLLLPAGHGRGAVGLMVGMGRIVALARAGSSLTMTELDKILWW